MIDYLRGEKYLQTFTGGCHMCRSLALPPEESPARLARARDLLK